MTDVVLVSARLGEQVITEPLSTEFLAAFMRKNGYDTEVYTIESIDRSIGTPQFLGGPLERFVQRVKEVEPSILGISAIAERDRPEVYRTVRVIRQTGFEGHVCVGGQDPSLNWASYLKECEGIDSIAIGEGEKTLLALTRAIAHSRDWRNIKGIAYRTARGKVRRNQPRRLVENLDSLPFMARDVLKEHVKLFGDRAIASIVSSRGCYQNCAFCSISSYYRKQKGRIFRQRSIKNVVSEMLELNRQFGISKFVFQDDNFLLPGEKGLERVEEFQREIMRRLKFKIEINIACRVDNISRAAIELLKTINTRKIIIGIESFIDRDLELYNKNLTSKQNTDALDMLNSLGYSAKVGSFYRTKPGVILFNPFTNTDDLRKQLRYFKKYDFPPKKLVTKLLVYSHTRIEQFLKEQNLLDSDNKIKFLNNEVESIYNACSRYFAQIQKYRERIRTIEKTCEEFTDRSIDELTCIRTKMDSECYDFFESLLEFVGEGNGPEEICERCEEQIQTIEKRLNINDFDSTLKSVEEQLGISFIMP